MADPLEGLVIVFIFLLFFIIFVSIVSRKRSGSDDDYVDGFRDAQAVDFAFSLLELGLRLCVSSSKSGRSHTKSLSKTVSSSSSSSSASHTSTSHGGTKRR